MCGPLKVFSYPEIPYLNSSTLQLFRHRPPFVCFASLSFPIATQKDLVVRFGARIFFILKKVDFVATFGCLPAAETFSSPTRHLSLSDYRHNGVRFVIAHAQLQTRC